HSASATALMRSSVGPKLTAEVRLAYQPTGAPCTPGARSKSADARARRAWGSIRRYRDEPALYPQDGLGPQRRPRRFLACAWRSVARGVDANHSDEHQIRIVSHAHR